MVLGCIPHCVLAFFIMMLPPALLTDECTSSSTSTVRLSARSHRNMTGHWIAEASLTRRSSRDSSDVRNKERPWHYDVDITRLSCDQEETLTTTFNVVVPPPRVGADYTFFPNVGFYKLHTEQTNWEDARRKCEEEGAHLAIVNSEAEENAIRELMRAYKKDLFAAFIGVHDKFKEGEYVTIFGKPLSSTGRVNWGQGEPNNKIFPDSPEGEDCVDLYSNGVINDNRCSVKQSFVCEQSL